MFKLGWLYVQQISNCLFSVLAVLPPCHNRSSLLQRRRPWRKQNRFNSPPPQQKHPPTSSWFLMERQQRTQSQLRMQQKKLRRSRTVRCAPTPWPMFGSRRADTAWRVATAHNAWRSASSARLLLWKNCQFKVGVQFTLPGLRRSANQKLRFRSFFLARTIS